MVDIQAKPPSLTVNPAIGMTEVDFSPLYALDHQLSTIFMAPEKTRTTLHAAKCVPKS